MSVRRLIYVSRVGRQVRFADAEAIAAAASRRNVEAGITGLLLYTPSHFVQVLEGEPDAVSQTLARIRSDLRHASMVILDDRSVDSREFSAWGMRAHYCFATASALEELHADSAFALLCQARDDIGP